jgi:hypothetical protein
VDPHYFRKLDQHPDPHYVEKVVSGFGSASKSNSEELLCVVEAQNGAVEGRGRSQWRRGGSQWSTRRSGGHGCRRFAESGSALSEKSDADPHYSEKMDPDPH